MRLLNNIIERVSREYSISLTIDLLFGGPTVCNDQYYNEFHFTLLMSGSDKGSMETNPCY